MFACAMSATEKKRVFVKMLPIWYMSYLKNISNGLPLTKCGNCLTGYTHIYMDLKPTYRLHAQHEHNNYGNYFLPKPIPSVLHTSVALSNNALQLHPYHLNLIFYCFIQFSNFLI